MGIIVAREGATLPWAACNICSKRVVPGLQRIIVDDRFEDQWWNHLECARLDLFIEDEHDTKHHLQSQAAMPNVHGVRG